MHHRLIICHLCTKIIWTYIAKTELQVDFSHKFSKKDFLFKWSDRQLMPIYIVQLKIILPNLIYINRGMIKQLGAIFSKVLKTFLRLKGPQNAKNSKNPVSSDYTNPKKLF